MESTTAEGQAGISSSSMIALDQPAIPINIPLNPMVMIRLSGDDPWRFWETRKSKLVEYSGFFRAMFKHDFKEASTNLVMLHDDDPKALDDLLMCIKYGDTDRLTVHDQWPCVWMEQFLHLYFLIYKYDCPQIRDAAVEALDSSIRSHWCYGGATPYNQERWPKFSSSHIALAIENNGSDYPRGLAPTLAKMWAQGRRYGADCSRIVALLESDPALYTAVTTYYQDTYIQSEKAREEAQARRDHGPGFIITGDDDLDLDDLDLDF